MNLLQILVLAEYSGDFRFANAEFSLFYVFYCLVLQISTSKQPRASPEFCFSPKRIIFREIIFVCENTTLIFGISDHFVSNHFTV